MNKGQLTANFHIREFKCNDGTQVPAELYPNVLELAKQLQVIRDHIKEPIHLNSAYRSPAYNKAIGGVANSQHLLAKAADCTTKSYTPKQFAAIVEQLIKEGKVKIGGIGVYPGFVHLDIRKEKARW
jgi:uncharacterized protein YcbK (DUF882 family)